MLDFKGNRSLSACPDHAQNKFNRASANLTLRAFPSTWEERTSTNHRSIISYDEIFSAQLYLRTTAGETSW